MSNQVYSATGRKFFEQPGVNSYSLLGPVTIGASGANAVIHFVSEIEQIPGSITINGAGNFIADSPGYYAFSGYLEITPAPAVTDLDIEVVMNISSATSSNGVNVSRVRCPFPNVKAGVGGTVYVIIPFDFKIFLEIDDAITITVYNWDNNSHSIIVEEAFSSLAITKIY